MTSESNQETVIPLHVEEVLVAKEQITTGRLRVSTVTHQCEVLVDELLKQEKVTYPGISRNLPAPP